ncbi:hypothetical protein [Planococcus sp. YIM B11945]|uniref:hypothetical protein n=1 Tax=Planococcus sp. YIM B11945 TaxID=3435410 RepID=UPI003D7CA5A6
MYTYETFETLGVFTLMRPVFYTALFISVGLFAAIIFMKRSGNFLNGFAVIGISAATVMLSGEVLIYDSIIVDELGLGGDSLSFFLFLATFVLGFVNPFVYFAKRSQMLRSSKKI